MKAWIFLLLAIGSFFIPFFTSLIVRAENCTLAITVEGAITAATKDYFERTQGEARKRSCNSILVRMNTPGGDLQATRLVVEKILDSDIPFLCLITPRGGHAGSAGALILQACHISGGLAATNVGAATPILGSGQTLSEDLRKKMINDTVSWSQGLAKLRGRNLDFARDIVTEAQAISSEEAVKLKAMDIFARDESDFLAQAQGRSAKLRDKDDGQVEVGSLSEFATDTRYKILSFVADPEFAYLLFMASLALLYFEITHPGFIAPGVIGGLGLVLSLISFHKLEVQWGGLALMLLGIAFLIAEIFVPSFGILGVGGVVALVMGSLFLFDTEVSGYSLPISLVLTVSLLLGAVVIGLGMLAMRTWKMGRKEVTSDFIGKIVAITEIHSERTGQIEILGEIWKFESSDPIRLGDRVQVLERQGLLLKVKKV